MTPMRFDVAAAALLRHERVRGISDGAIAPREDSVYELALRLLRILGTNELVLTVRLPHVGLNPADAREIFRWETRRHVSWLVVFAGATPAAALRDALAFHDPIAPRLVTPTEIRRCA